MIIFNYLTGDAIFSIGSASSGSKSILIISREIIA
jgi:hypothetical protein